MGRLPPHPRMCPPRRAHPTPSVLSSQTPHRARQPTPQSKQPGSSPSLLKKQVALVEGLLVGELKYKDYGGKHGRLHHFTLEARRDGATR